MQKKQKIGIVAGLAAMAVVAMAVVLWPRGADKSEAGESSDRSDRVQAQSGRRGSGTGAGASKVNFKIQRMNTADRDDLSPKDKRLMIAIEDALEEESLKKLLAVFPDVLKSDNVELRSDMVDALDWFGVKAMPELLAFVTDPDEEVAEAALSAWTSALSDIESDKERVSLVEKAMKIIKDEDALESMVMELDDCDDVVAVQALIEVISSDNPTAVKVAKRHYKFLTDEKFTSFEAAEKWLQENYEVDDDEEDGAVVKYSSKVAKKRSGSSRKSRRGSNAAAEPADDGDDGDMESTADADMAGCDKDDQDCAGEDKDDPEDPDDTDDDDDDEEDKSDMTTGEAGATSPADSAPEQAQPAK